MSTLLYLAIMIFTGMLFGRLAKLVRLPNVTGYLVGGLIIGPSVLNLIPADALNGMNLISDVALGFIAFSIGNEFKISYFKRVGATPIVIAILESLLAVIFVVIGLLIAGCSLPFSLVLGSIAAATAPAATIMVIKQYKAKGPMTETLLSVVAIDDATALIFFGICVAIAGALEGSGTSLGQALLSPLIEILGAVVVGFVLGLLFLIPMRWFKKDGNRLSLTIGFVLVTVAISMAEFDVGGVHIGFSSLLVCMMLGTVFCNLCPLSADLMEKADRWTSPLFALFFVVSGAELELHVFTEAAIVGIGVVYILFRSLGKYYGSLISTRLTHCAPPVCKYLGITLLPQAGVALGMCITARQLGPEGDLIRNITLFAVLIYELVGPVLTKQALTKAGDIKPMPDEVKYRRERKLAESGSGFNQ